MFLLQKKKKIFYFYPRLYVIHFKFYFFGLNLVDFFCVCFENGQNHPFRVH